VSAGAARRRVVVAGIGSEFRRDDGAGPAVARRVASSARGTGDVGPVGEPLDLLGRWDDADLAIVIDTVRSGAPAGAVTVIEIGEDGTPPEGGRPSTSTHGIGLVGALRIARAIGDAPSRVVIVAIEGSEFGPGVGLTPAVEAAVDEATERVIELLGVTA